MSKQDIKERLISLFLVGSSFVGCIWMYQNFGMVAGALSLVALAYSLYDTLREYQEDDEEQDHY